MQLQNSLKLLLITALLLCYGQVSGQTADMSLSDCINYAYDNHPDIKIAQLQARDAEWQLKESKAVGLHGGKDFLCRLLTKPFETALRIANFSPSAISDGENKC